MFSNSEIVTVLEALAITHVVWVPDSTLGKWETALETSRALKLIRVCREGEAWPLAAGLHLGGRSPIVLMQTTGFFESGDAFRNVVFDLRVPLFGLIGARNWLCQDSSDSARQFTRPILNAWGVDSRWITRPDEKQLLAEHFLHCRRLKQAGLVVLAEN